MDYDGSQIPADWYGWMHYKVIPNQLQRFRIIIFPINTKQTDLPPHRDGLRPKYEWMADHSENLSGTKHQYAPFTTTPPKIEAWVPKGKN